MKRRRIRYKGVEVSDGLTMLTGALLALILGAALLGWLWDTIQQAFR